MLTPYETEYRYDIQWMRDTYGEYCVVDDMIGFLSLLMALSIYFRDNGQINLESQYKKLCYDYINMYNSNQRTFNDNNLETIGQLVQEL